MDHWRRWMLGGLALLVVAFPLVIWGTILAVGTCRNDIVNWSAPGSLARENFDAFRQRFGENDLLFVSWPGCHLDDQRLTALQRELESPRYDPYFRHILSGRNAHEILTDDSDFTAAQASARLHGVIVGGDNKSTGISLSLTKDASGDRGGALLQLGKALTAAGVDPDEARIAGPAHDIYALDMEGLWSPLRAVPFIMLLSFTLTWVFTARFDLAAAISVLSWFAGLFTMTAVYVIGVPLNAVVWTLPTLVMLLTVSASLHFLAYYREALRRNSDEATALLAFRLAAKPTMYCALTTSAGLFSLLLSDTEPVRQFGCFGGAAVLVSCAIVLCCLPAWLLLRPLPVSTANRSPVIPTGCWTVLAQFTQRRRGWIFLASGLTVLGLGYSVPQLRTSVNIRQLFPASSNVIQDTQWIEDRVCQLSSIELVLLFESPDAKNDLQRLRLLQYLSAQFRQHQHIEGAFSAATFAPPLPRFSSNLRGIVARRIAVGKVRRLKDELPELGLLATNGREEAWRLSARVSNLAEIDYENILLDLQGKANAIFTHDGECVLPGERFSLICTGRVPVFTSVERQFLRDLRTTYATAFAVISVVVLIVMRSASACFLATIPNLFPAVTVLGATALLGYPLDVASLMTASVALGIAVDDTLHFMLWWRKKIHAGFSPREAVVDAMEHCGAAMTQTSVVCGVSVALYALCGFLPTVRFGLLLSAMMFAALMGDLFLLPALLSTRLAKRIANATPRL